MMMSTPPPRAPPLVVPDVAGGLTEEKVAGKSFELVFAFDEVITTGGHKESITLQQVRVDAAPLALRMISRKTNVRV